ncbi:hypothetical protein K32_43730 [Kaistia sp. 32K]|nr:hypothetical protein K32_43730 [Kaistia sp. 32K]
MRKVVPAFHMVDALWCDQHGVFVKGWAHVSDVAPRAIHLKSGAARVTTTEFSDRPDLLTHYPRLDSTRCGFALYLPCPPFRPVTLEVESSLGTVEIDVTALPPDHPQNAIPNGSAAPLDRFAAAMKQIRGTVLEIGARTVSPGAVLNASLFEPECTFIGFDIHAAPGVDIVGDAHFLGDYVEPASLDGVLSYAVVEHLAYPWLLAAEINKVLKVGGLTMHSVPHSFPLHELPNDFWRMSSEGLKVLLSPSLGFEVLACGMAEPVRMLVQPSLRQGPMLEFPLHDGMTVSWILARKIFDLPEGAVAWPVARELSLQQGMAYPSHTDA